MTNYNFIFGVCSYAHKTSEVLGVIPPVWMIKTKVDIKKKMVTVGRIQSKD